MIVLYSFKKDLIRGFTINRFANRNLTRRCTIIRFAHDITHGCVAHEHRPCVTRAASTTHNNNALLFTRHDISLVM